MREELEQAAAEADKGSPVITSEQVSGSGEEEGDEPQSNSRAKTPVAPAEQVPGSGEEEGDEPQSNNRPKKEVISELEQQLAAREEDLTRLREELAAAVARYRHLVLAAAPEVPEEMVQGETIEEVDASLATARSLVDKVRRKLEAEVEAGRVPAGAPPRSAPDLSALSPAEKIAYALATR